jgi:hypothetical protein
MIIKEMNNKQGKDLEAWSRWYSWGSPVGLGIYLLSLAGSVWIFAHLKPKNKK